MEHEESSVLFDFCRFVAYPLLAGSNRFAIQIILSTFAGLLY